jgi:hypothetical protein
MNGEKRAFRSHLRFTFLAVALLMPLTACKPKHVCVSGQVFIVTSNSQNVRLGLVEVDLIALEDFVTFTTTRQQELRNEISAREKRVAIATSELANANTTYQTFLTNGPLGNASYLRKKSERDALMDQTSKLAKKGAAASKKIEEMENLSEVRHDDREAAELLRRLETISYNQEIVSQSLTTLRTSMAELAEIQKELEPIETPAFAKKKQFEETIKATRAKLSEAQQTPVPTLEQLFAGLQAKALTNALTDADGRFKLNYERNKSFVIYAHADRLVGDTKEMYFWTLNAPTNFDTVELFLSNHNQAFSDPDHLLDAKLLLALKTASNK